MLTPDPVPAGTSPHAGTARPYWGDRPAVVFGDLMLPPPAGSRLVGAYRKPSNAGHRGAIGGRRRDAEAVYWLGSAWTAGLGGRSSVLTTRVRSAGNPSSPAGKTGHPHAKPLDVMEDLLELCPPGVVADPFAGSGSTLIAARQMGRRAIGVELEESWCELIARRLDQGVLDLGGVTA